MSFNIKILTTNALTLIDWFLDWYNFLSISTPSDRIPVALSFLEAEYITASIATFYLKIKFLKYYIKINELLTEMNF